MKLAFSILPLKSGHKLRGMGNYTQNLLNHLKSIEDLKIQEFVDLKKVKKVDLIHLPYFDLFFPTLPLRKKSPTVVTIGDVTPLVFPKNYPPGIKGRLAFFKQKLALKRIDGVVTFSEASKKDIHQYLGVPLSKIQSIYLAPGYEFSKMPTKVSSSILEKYNLPVDYAIYVGSVNYNKNLLNTAEACLKVGLDLVLVGSDFLKTENLSHPELKSFSEFLKKYENNPQVHILGYVPGVDLIHLIKGARVLALVSFYEGFGLPILEAQAVGTPVITANTSSMPEVGGEGGAVYVDPSDLGKITKGLESILKDKKLTDKMIERGLENVKRFSWKKCAKETYEFYQQIIQK